MGASQSSLAKREVEHERQERRREAELEALAEEKAKQSLATVGEKMVELVGSTRVAVLNRKPPDEDENAYVDIARFAGVERFDPTQWVAGSPRLRAEEYPPGIVGGTFEPDGHFRPQPATIGTMVVPPLERGDNVVLVRLYARMKPAQKYPRWPVRAVNIGILPLLCVTDESCATRSGGACVVASVRLLPVERATSVADISSGARDLACGADLRIRPAGCDSCMPSGYLAADNVWKPRLEACKREMVEDEEVPRVTFFLFECPTRVVQKSGAYVDSNAERCNKLIVQRFRHKEGTNSYSVIMSYTRFLLRVAQMQTADNQVDQTQMQELADAGFYANDPEFQEVLKKLLGKRVACFPMDLDQLNGFLVELFQKGYVYRRFSMQAHDAPGWTPPAKTTPAAPGDATGLRGEQLSKKLDRLGYAGPAPRPGAVISTRRPRRG